MAEEVTVLVWENVGVRNEVVIVAAELLLSLHVIKAQSVLSCDFIRLREVVESLELVQTFVNISFATAASPEQVPLVRLSVREPISLAKRPNKLGVSLQDFVEHFVVIDVISASRSASVPVGVSRWRIV
jgi:hypothetical protein